jgi:putative RecB family exonuclease
MSVLSIDRAHVDPPAVLPVDYLSLTSLKQYLQCPIKWKRRYIDKQPEPSSASLVLGGATHAALAQHYSWQIERGAGITVDELLDEYSAAFDGRVEQEDVEWKGETPGLVKDSGVGALRFYHGAVAPRIRPVSVERQFEMSWPGVQWRLTGYIDLETDDGAVADYKALAKRMSQNDADSDLQPTTYLAARRAENQPASRFDFHMLVRNKTPVADVLSTERADHELDLLTDRIFAIAAEIDWRCESGIWTGAAPQTWFCGLCRYHDCPWRLGRV